MVTRGSHPRPWIHADQTELATKDGAYDDRGDPVTPLRLTLSCGVYEITRPLLTGEVRPEGIELTGMTDDPNRIYSLRRRNEADIGEFNIVEYFRAKEYGHPLTALAVFPHRRFREGYYFVRADGPVSVPRDVIGRRAGISGAGRPAAGVWMRGILQDHHDVPLDEVEWLENYMEPMDGSPVREVEQQVTADSLLSGDIDLLLAPMAPEAFDQGDPRIRRLFADDVAESIAYYHASRIFPIMHVVTIREELVERHPWVVGSLFTAFEAAKRLGFQRAANPRLVPLAFYENAWERQRDLLGPDPWEYGLGDANRHNLQTVLRYTREQGRITREPPLSELFTEPQ